MTVENISELIRIAKDPGKTIEQTLKRTGKKAVGVFPVYAAEEVIYAAGALPVGLWGGQANISKASQYLQSFCCSVMKANVENGLNGVYSPLSAVVIPTFCDTLKCIGEVWKTAVDHPKSITFVYPQNRKLDAGAEFMERELKRLAEEIEAITGNDVKEEDLEKSIAVYNEYRRAAREFVKISPDYPKTIGAKERHNILKAAFFMDKKEYTEKLLGAIEELKAKEKERTSEKGVVITGLLAEPDEFLDLFSENGMLFAADDLVQESKQFRHDVPEEGDSPIARLAHRVVVQDGCSLLYDCGKSRGAVIIDLVRKTKADGVVVCMMKFCDPEEFDYPIYKKEIENEGIPMLYLEIEQKMDSVEQLRTRIQTFAEMLGDKRCSSE